MRVWVLTVLVVLACTDQEPGQPAVASVAVTSALDSLIDVGGTARLTAAPRDAAGTPVPGVAITWSSSNATALNVNGAGLVSALAIGSATITAAVPGPVAGTFRMRAVDADVATVTTLAGDPHATALIGAVSSGKRPALQTAWTLCASGATAGNLVAVVQCGTGVSAEAASATDAADRVLIGILQLFSDEAVRRLGL